MKRTRIAKLHNQFERLVQTDLQTGTEFWLARDLQQVLGYVRWANFRRVIDKAVSACERAGYDAKDHFLAIEKVTPEHGDERDVDDYALTRYAAYLVAQNADSSKDQVAFAQTYFAVQTRRQELIEKRLEEMERVSARRKLTQSEKALSGWIYEHVEDEGGFSRIRRKGDRALFGGTSTRQMKQRLRVPKNRPLADFLPTITIKAKDFANEITNFTVRRDYLHTEAQISRAHIKNNREVRQLLLRQRIKPEELPAAEDVKKVERRLTSEERRLPREIKRLRAPKTSRRE